MWAAEDTVICHGQDAVMSQKGKIWIMRQVWTPGASTRPQTAGRNEQDEEDDGVYGCASVGARVDVRSCVYKYVHEMETGQEEEWSEVETNEQNAGKVGGGGIFLNKSETQAQPDSDRVQVQVMPECTCVQCVRACVQV